MNNVSQISLRDYARYARNCGEERVLTYSDFSNWSFNKLYIFTEGLKELLTLEEEGVLESITEDKSLIKHTIGINREFQIFYFDTLLNENREDISNIMRRYGKVRDILEKYDKDSLVVGYVLVNDKELGKIVDYESRMKLKAELSTKLNSSPKANLQNAD